MKKRNKAVSPVISTVLLILIVIILAIIIFLWSRGFFKEVIEKQIGEDRRSADQLCSELGLKPIINGNQFGFENNGNVPVYAYIVKYSNEGNSDTREFKEEGVGSAPPGTLAIAEGMSYSGYEEIKIIPILLGEGEDGATKEFQCPEITAIKIK